MSYTDEELLSAIKGNDPRSRNLALKQLYMDPAVNAKARDYITTYGADKLEVDDVIQEAIILLDDAIRNDKFHGKSKVRTFLIGVCKNLIRNKGRKIERITFSVEPHQVPESDDEEKSPEDQVIMHEYDEATEKRNKVLHELLGALSDGCKQLLTLYYFMQQSLTQVADQVGLKNAHQAKKKAHRCRKKLQSLILEDPQLAHLFKEMS